MRSPKPWQDPTRWEGVTCPHCDAPPGSLCKGPGVVAGAHASRKDVAARNRVRPGQVWEDCDPRTARRRLRVLKVDDGVVRCEVLGAKRYRETSISLTRMRPGSTGYRLVKEADCA